MYYDGHAKRYAPLKVLILICNYFYKKKKIIIITNVILYWIYFYLYNCICYNSCFRVEDLYLRSLYCTYYITFYATELLKHIKSSIILIIYVRNSVLIYAILIYRANLSFRYLFMCNQHQIVQIDRLGKVRLQCIHIILLSLRKN